MTTVTDRPGVLPATVAAEPEARSSSVMGIALALPAVALAVASLLVGSEPSAAEVVRAVLVVLWAAAGATLTTRRRHSRLGPIVLGGATVGALGALANAVAVPPRTDGRRRRDRRPHRPDLRRPAACHRHALPAGDAPGTPGDDGAASGGSRHVRRLGVDRAGPHVRPRCADRLAARPAVADRPGGRAGRRPRPLPDGRRHRPPAHAVGRVGDGRGRRGGPRRHRPERADRPSRRSGGVGHRRDRASFPWRSSPAPTPGRSPASTGCSPTPSRWPA